MSARVATGKPRRYRAAYRGGEPLLIEKGSMKGPSVRLDARETQIVKLLIRGCDNAEIARQLKIARGTVKANLERLFRRFRITGGIKRVKLATLVLADTKVSANGSYESIVSNKREEQVIQLVAEGLKNRRAIQTLRNLQD